MSKATDVFEILCAAATPRETAFCDRQIVSD
jgi:hypothetical protein